MTAQQESAEARLADLRSRLYRADATEEDLQRYLAERDAVIPEDPEPDTAAARPRPRRRPRILLSAGLVLAVAATGAALSVLRPGAEVVDAARATASAGVASPAATATPAGRLRVQDVGEGQVLSVREGAVSGPVPTATTIRGTAVVGELYQGTGNAVVPIEPPPGPVGSGRAMVSVTSNGSSPIAWRALLLVTRNDWSSSPIVLARGLTADGSGAASPITFVYPSRAPSRIAVAAPDGVRWSLLVAVRNGLDPELR